jgi:hypothetical protein
MTSKKLRVVFDTNVLIAFLIGKRLGALKTHLANGLVVIVVSDRLLEELLLVTTRPKLRKYFPNEAVAELITLLDVTAEKVNAPAKHALCRDAKDNFLLDLIEHAKVDYLVTGDQDLLMLHPFGSTQIVTPTFFSSMLLE